MSQSKTADYSELVTNDDDVPCEKYVPLNPEDEIRELRAEVERLRTQLRAYEVRMREVGDEETIMQIRDMVENHKIKNKLKCEKCGCEIRMLPDGFILCFSCYNELKT